MIPLSWFLIGWIILIGIFLVVALITILIHLRFGISGFTTYASSVVFLIVAGYVLLVSGSYLATVDWSQSLDIVTLFQSWLPF